LEMKAQEESEAGLGEKEAQQAASRQPPAAKEMETVRSRLPAKRGISVILCGLFLPFSSSNSTAAYPSTPL
jgi:hypothetical protein